MMNPMRKKQFINAAELMHKKIEKTAGEITTSFDWVDHQTPLLAVLA